MHAVVQNNGMMERTGSCGALSNSAAMVSLDNVADAPPNAEELEQLSAKLAGLYEELKPKLLRFVEARISARLHSLIDAECVLHDALRRLMETLREKRPESEKQLRAWLYVKVWSQLQDELRKWNTSTRDMQRVGPFPDESIVEMIHRIGLSTHLGFKDLVELIRLALSPTEFEIIWLKIVDELSYGEIALISGLTEDAVRKRHVRALLKVRNTVADPFASSTGPA